MIIMLLFVFFKHTSLMMNITQHIFDSSQICIPFIKLKILKIKKV